MPCLVSSPGGVGAWSDPWIYPQRLESTIAMARVEARIRSCPRPWLPCLPHSPPATLPTCHLPRVPSAPIFTPFDPFLPADYQREAATGCTCPAGASLHWRFSRFFSRVTGLGAYMCRPCLAAESGANQPCCIPSPTPGFCLMWWAWAPLRSHAVILLHQIFWTWQHKEEKCVLFHWRQQGGREKVGGG